MYLTHIHSVGGWVGAAGIRSDTVSENWADSVMWPAVQCTQEPNWAPQACPRSLMGPAGLDHGVMPGSGQAYYISQRWLPY